ncbi:MAG TPA: hydantoinase/oxoprolinase family protein [Vicinamibacterales bacterium]|nr:hydantoinase/oxoprolinase family protein [Vicinamibacterales bacterium]
MAASSNSVAAVDVGGTFTDIAAWDAGTGSLRTHKLLTTTRDPSQAIVEGLRSTAVGVSAVVHGTTLVTNSLIERRGATVGLITTDGYRDVLEIGNELRYDTFDLALRRPAPLVPRVRRSVVPERIDAAGTEVQPLDLEAVACAGQRLIEMGADAIAVCFINSFAEPSHERAAVKQLSEAHPEVAVCGSAEVSGEVREYERFSTATANAYVQPLMSRFLDGLGRRLEVPLFLVLSDGTIAGVPEVVRHPILMVESGPAAGAMAVVHKARELGWPAVIGLDMGGTTAKISLVHDGVAQTAHSLEVARLDRFKKGSGLPLRLPTVELIEIGAGGGSVAHVDQLGLLKVGPRSAGAEPGPACYGLGGLEPTVTDADLVLGYVSPEGLVGGRVPLDRAEAITALGRIGDALGLSAEDTAAGIVDVVSTQMATAARIHLAEHGRDPRRYRLVAFGGAGPVHAHAVARTLGVNEILFPADAGIASALGMLVAPRGVERVRSYRCLLERVDWDHASDLLADLEQAARSVLREARVDDADVEVRVALDMRYAGQGHELTIATNRDALARRDEKALRTAFEIEYRRRYGLALGGMPIEVVSWRVNVKGPPVLEVANATRKPAAGADRPKKRRAFFRDGGGFIEIPVWIRQDLRVGNVVAGPALIEEETTTIVVAPGWDAELDDIGNVLMRSTP